MKLKTNSLKSPKKKRSSSKEPKLKDALKNPKRTERKKTNQVAPPQKKGDTASSYDVYDKLCTEGLTDVTEHLNLADVIYERPGKSKTNKDRQEIIGGILDGMYDIHSTVKAKPFKVKRTQKGQTLMLLFSDWHYGKVIQTTSGRRIFDSKIAKERIEKELTTKIIERLQFMGKDAKIEDVVLVLAGDIVDNDIIYDTQRFHVDSGVAEQFHGVTRAILQMIYELKNALKTIYKKDIPIKVECLTGNHGRSGKASELGICSWDTAVYSALQLAVDQAKDLKNVKVDFTVEDFKVIDVRGHRGLILHKGPPQAETPSAKKKFGGWYEIFEYDFAMYGHLHHWGVATYNGRPLFMNGSLCGYDDFALSLAVRDDWAQLMWTVSEDEVMNQLVRIKR